MTGLLDREKGELYTLTVVADDGGPKKDSTVVRSINGSGLSFHLHSDFITECVAHALL